ncbi:DUF559 domain-containing protein [Longispora sp. K20-0274]|uniref:DUF559 domain-containing protein n=1 Tax=Longispora sp. K20-0274 TaxID=3088255 RepID=UPI00399A3DB9
MDELGTGHGGLFTRAQAGAAGYSTYQIRRRIAAGHWVVVLGGALARSGIAVTPQLRDRAALLTVTGSILGGPSAARLHGMSTPDQGSYLFVADGHHLKLRGVTGLRCALAEDEVTQVDGLLVTTVARTVFDCLRVLPFESAEAVLDRALQTRRVGLRHLAGLARIHAGTHGVRQVGRLVQRAKPGARFAAERRLVAMLRRARITGWRANVEVAGAIVDLAFHGVRLAVEADGRAWHSAAGRFERDRERQNRIVAEGWHILRFTWRDITDRPDYVLATIQAMLTRLGRAA